MKNIKKKKVNVVVSVDGVRVALRKKKKVSVLPWREYSERPAPRKSPAPRERPAPRETSTQRETSSRPGPGVVLNLVRTLMCRTS